MTQLARNVATTYVARLAIVCSGLFLFPFVTHHVGLTHYGIWLLVNGVTVFFLTADFGMGTSVVRYVAQAQAVGDMPRMNRVVASTLAFYLGLAVLAAGLFAGCFALFWPAFNIPAADRGVAAQMIAIVAIGQLLVGVPLGVFRQTLVGLQRMDLVNAIMLGQTALRVTGVTAVVLASSWRSRRSWSSARRRPSSATASSPASTSARAASASRCCARWRRTARRSS